MDPVRPRISDPAALAALAHPVRLDVLDFLMSRGPATASACARAVGDSPSNCSYHLRVLASHGLVQRAPSEDGRERPWEALITGFDIGTQGEEGDDSADAALAEASAQLDLHRLREHLRSREELPAEWRDVDAHAGYGLRVTPAELADILRRVDDIVRPYIAATREEDPEGSRTAHLSLLAFPHGREWQA